MKIYQDGKAITKQAAAELVGEKKLADRIADARATHGEDPLTEISWMDGMEIRFSK